MPSTSTTGYRLPRRSVLGAAAGLGAVLAAAPVFGAAAPARAADAPAGAGLPDGPESSHLIVLFLDGGFDGLAAVAPLDDADYRRARPDLALPGDRLTPLGTRWGLHPGLADLLTLWQRQELSIVHGVGLPEPSSSHFTERARLADTLDLVGVRAAGVHVTSLTLGNWDMHHSAGNSADPQGWFSRRATRLAATIAALPAALGAQWQRTTVLTVTEFGRQVAQNSGGGLEHGQASAMFLAGGGFGDAGGADPGPGEPEPGAYQLRTRIDSLQPGALTAEGGLPCSIDLREVLARVVAPRLRLPDGFWVGQSTA
ncbi:DUF1501 domain-containing protein [Granulicoccus phenolivorans]|uniref:DUF1501 domain-containing protein n=1 Tax=Granulicoccus phenolivorans TaxID=266854 RepID=UPI000424E5AB|nr:DUF1501 domain-containing protein [Granulicoccus phenolivorans]